MLQWTWSRPEMDRPCKVDSCLRHWPHWWPSLLAAVVPPDADWFVSGALCLKTQSYNRFSAKLWSLLTKSGTHTHSGNRQAHWYTSTSTETRKFSGTCNTTNGNLCPSPEWIWTNFSVHDCTWQGEDSPFYLGTLLLLKKWFPCLDYKTYWHHNAHNYTLTPFHSALLRRRTHWEVGDLCLALIATLACWVPLR